MCVHKSRNICIYISRYVLLPQNLKQSAPLSFGANSYWSWVIAAVMLGIHLLHREPRGTLLFEWAIYSFFVPQGGQDLGLGFFKQILFSSTYIKSLKCCLYESIGSQRKIKLFFGLNYNLSLAKTQVWGPVSLWSRGRFSAEQELIQLVLKLMSDVFSLSAVPTGDQAQRARKDTGLI